MSNKQSGNSEEQKPFTVIIETLTGTTFEVKVSPQDKVKTIKCKIHRVEGIPVSHQHLLYNMQELQDTACVSDPSVGLRDRAKVRLVLSMRGGPISLVHQTVPFSKTTLRNLIKLNRREDTADELPPGCKMAVLVLRVGDQLNLLHVVEDLDGSDCDESEILNPSLDLLEGEPLKSLEENSRTMEKVCDLKEKLAKLSLQQKNHKFKMVRNCHREGTLPIVKTSCSLRLPSIHHTVKDEIFKSRSEFSQIPVLPDIVTQQNKSSVPLEPDFIQVREESVDFKMCDNVRPKTCPGALNEDQCFKLVDEVECEKALGMPHSHFRSCVSACTTKLHHEWTGRKSLLQSLNIPPPLSTVSNVLSERSRQLNTTSSSVPSVENIELDHRVLRSALKSRQIVTKDEIDSQNTENNSNNILSLSSENMTCSESTFQLWNRNPIYPPFNNNAVYNESAPATSLCGVFKNSSNIDSIEQTIQNNYDFNKKRKHRCSECKKKLTLTSTFDCRCGLTFCGFHRYSEAHNCSFDFKKDSRKILERANPSVVTPKLPKI